MSRPSTGKRLRFEIFKRDAFTCQYCGAQPPDVVLVVDHIDPAANGGASDQINLITACEPCNQGKGARPLTTRIVRPDADLLFLETQQEIAELRRYQAALAEREQVLAESVGQLQDVWCDITKLDWAPSDAIVRQLLIMYGPSVTADSLSDVASKIRTGYIHVNNHFSKRWVGYLYKVAKNMAAEGAA